MKNMKYTIALTTALLAAGAILAAETPPTNQVANAITKLKAATNYSWTSTLKIGDNDIGLGPVNGQANKEGFAKMSQDYHSKTFEIVLKGEKVAYKGQNGWQLLGKVDGFETLFSANMARNGAAAQEAGITLKGVKELKALDGGALGGDLTSEGAADLFAFGPRGASDDKGIPQTKNAKGSVKFWIKDGMLTKYEMYLQGTVTTADNEGDVDMTKTIEIQNVGTTKMDVPTEAKEKLQAKADTR